MRRAARHGRTTPRSSTCAHLDPVPVAASAACVAEKSCTPIARASALATFLRRTPRTIAVSDASLTIFSRSASAITAR